MPILYKILRFFLKISHTSTAMLLCCFAPKEAVGSNITTDETLMVVDEALMVVDSDFADYNGKTITLNGHVVVEHEFGVISANWVEVIPQTIHKKFRLNSLTMKEDVNIALKDGGRLCCANAFLDYMELKGRFEGDSQQQFVTYTENCPDMTGAFNLKTAVQGDKVMQDFELEPFAMGAGHSQMVKAAPIANGYGSKDCVNLSPLTAVVKFTPLIVKSKEMLIKIARSDANSTQAPHSYISTITANDSVTVNYNNDFIAAADHGTYQRLQIDPNIPVQNTQMPGLITLRADKENAVCQLTNRNGDIIKANTICIDTVKRQLLFTYPKGAISTTPEKEQKNRVDFSGDTMAWDDQNNVLTLRDHVIVSQKGIGQITTDKEIRLTQHAVNGMKQLKSIASTGPTTLLYSDEEKELAHTLTCQGLLFVDHEHLQTVMESPRDPKGKVIEGCQVHFQDHMGEIYADKIVIKYSIIDHTPTPTHMVLEGHVHLMNRCAIDAERQGPYLQFALADRVEYTPEAKEIHLSAKGKKGRILFFDKLNNLQVSAPGLKIRRDQTTKKDSIQGIGNVRFSFIEKEFAEMNKYFHLETGVPFFD